MTGNCEPSKLDWWNSVDRNGRLGFVYAMRADGLALQAIADLTGRSRENIRRYDRIADVKVCRKADLFLGVRYVSPSRWRP